MCYRDPFVSARLWMRGGVNHGKGITPATVLTSQWKNLLRVKNQRVVQSNMFILLTVEILPFLVWICKIQTHMSMRPDHCRVLMYLSALLQACHSITPGIQLNIDKNYAPAKLQHGLRYFKSGWIDTRLVTCDIGI